MRSSRLVLNTGVGTIEIRLQETQAPQTTRFVRQLVEAGHFDGAAFYRSTTLGVDGRHGLIQGGPLAPLFTATADPIPDIEMLDTVESTDQTGLVHRCGTVSLARDLMTSGRVLPELFILTFRTSGWAYRSPSGVIGDGGSGAAGVGVGGDAEQVEDLVL